MNYSRELLEKVVVTNRAFLRTRKGEYLIVAGGVALPQKDGDRGYAEDALVWAESKLLELDPAADLTQVRDVDHARAVARAQAQARPTWEQEKRWFKERLALKNFASALGVAHA